MVPSARSVPFKTPASVPPYADRMTPQFDLIGSAVSDMARTLDFYRRLGLDIPADADHEDHVEVALPGGLRLAWDTVTMLRGFHPDWTPPSGSPRASLAFRCADPAEVDRYWAALTEAGFHGEIAPWDAFWGQRYAILHDPDGNGIDLFAPLDPT
ncbi:Glyoxalase-like domain-containing protein [Micromonospora matsumotoense]|uniref:Glyoxalase-like domain-containing protein n=2 Tax=Micromonospora matsumotoense TaxID=121616 RepID=A0A1C4V3I3_9ACTN|nr:Glyoxalase-like domain-containing protein [Micromonospora matsumotoense]